MAVSALDLSAIRTFKVSSHDVDTANKWFKITPPPGAKLTLIPTQAGVMSTRDDVAVAGDYTDALGNVPLVAGQAYELRPLAPDTSGVVLWVALTSIGRLGYVVEYPAAF